MDFNFKLNVCSLNTRGLRNRKKRAKVINWSIEKKFNTIFLQETFVTDDFSSIFDKDFKEYGSVFHSTSKSPHGKGVAVILSNNFPDYNVLNIQTDNEGRKVMVNIEINGSKTIFTLVSIYAPNETNKRIDFFKELEKWIAKYAKSTENIIIGGDFNCCDKNDRQSKRLDKSFDAFIKLKKVHDLIDVFTFCNPNQNESTYFHPSDKSRNSRIDYILACNFISKFLKTSRIIYAPVPDHKAVTMILDTYNRPRGKGYWKLNNSVLEEETYKNLIREQISNTMSEYSNMVSKQNLLEMIKFRVKEQTIKYCIKKTRKEREYQHQLEKRLQYIDGLLSQKPDIDTIYAERQKIQSELNHTYAKKSYAAFIRSRCKWIEEGERSSSYFLGLEKKRQSHNYINQLSDEQGTLYTQDKEILNHCAAYYTNLYNSRKPQESNIEMYLNELKNLQTLTYDNQKSCEGLITKLECQKAIKLMKNNKSPGSDGLTIEFYKTFWSDISDILIDSFNESFDLGHLSYSQNISILSLIFKKGDPDNIKNYRPISLTNVDYRILAFVLAQRLQNVIGTIVSCNQTGYIKGRFIGTNVRAILDICEYIEDTNSSGILLQLDFEKAFDSVEWPFLIAVLRKYNFGENFINWIKVLYNKPELCIKNNGYFSNYIEMRRGIRQGCPVSALLFILIIETLAHSLQTEKSLQGVSVRLNNANLEYKCFQYADDINLFLLNEHQIEKALKLIENFSNVAGPVLNRLKTEGILLGCLKNKDTILTTTSIKWTQDPVRCLGIYIGNDKAKCDHLNWSQKLIKIQSELHAWKKRSLTLFGKIAIIKTLSIPKLLYPAHFLPVPPEIIKKANKMFYTFVWKSKDRIKRNTLISDISEGGLSMPDLDSKIHALKASWVLKILNSNEIWSSLGKHFLNLIPEYTIVKLNFENHNSFPDLKKVPQFYQDVIVSFNKSKICPKPSVKEDFLNQVLWGNRHITIRKPNTNVYTTIFFKEWFSSGIIFVRDLKFSDGVLDENFIYNKIIDKRNIFSQVITLRKSLKPFRELLDTHIPLGNSIEIPPIYHSNNTEHVLTDKKSIFYYKNLINQKTQRPYQEAVWADQFRNNVNLIDFKKVYISKIKMCRDLNVAQFNYKVLHLILPCLSNLKKWNIVTDSQCPLCCVKHDIIHLLFFCNKAQVIWSYITVKFNINLSLYDIICGYEDDPSFSFFISLSSFLIYKEWLTLYKDTSNWTNSDILKFVKCNMKTKLETYKNCNRISNDVLKLIEYFLL